MRIINITIIVSRVVLNCLKYNNEYNTKNKNNFNNNNFNKELDGMIKKTRKKMDSRKCKFKNNLVYLLHRIQKIYKINSKITVHLNHQYFPVAINQNYRIKEL